MSSEYKKYNMKLLSKIYDDFLKADNLLFESSIEEYLYVAREIINNNKYQRKRVRNSTSIYSLLRNDLKKLCTIPTIVLALKKEGFSDGVSKCFFDIPDNLMILDGLQRTYSLMDVYDELERSESEQFERFKNHLIRIELYNGISRTGILYRMLTLNTGQTPMTKRHEIEILYSDYLAIDLGEGVYLNTETSTVSSTKGIGVYNFSFAIEGFCALLEGDESQLTKSDLLVTVQELEKVSQDDYKKDLFHEFLLTYNAIAKKIDELTNNMSLSKGISYKSIFARNISEFMNKAQTFSAFGAAVGNSTSLDAFSQLQNIKSQIPSLIMSGSDKTFFLNSIIEKMEYIKQHAKRIGDGQRLFLKLFFSNLFCKDTDSYLNLLGSLNKAFAQYKNKIGNGSEL